jgi:hypothetical protein
MLKRQVYRDRKMINCVQRLKGRVKEGIKED